MGICIHVPEMTEDSFQPSLAAAQALRPNPATKLSSCRLVDTNSGSSLDPEVPFQFVFGAKPDRHWLSALILRDVVVSYLSNFSAIGFVV